MSAAAAEMYVIWSYEHDAWWKPNECGYTSNVREAGRYSATRAQWIVAQANRHQPYDAPHEIAIPAYAVHALSRARGPRYPSDIKAGDVVQIDPAHDERFGACFLLVTDVKSWGCVGFVKIPGQGDAYYRVEYQHVVRIGAAEWVPDPQTMQGFGPTQFKRGESDVDT